jgi:hypothetical protein
MPNPPQPAATSDATRDALTQRIIEKRKQLESTSRARKAAARNWKFSKSGSRRVKST